MRKSLLFFALVSALQLSANEVKFGKVSKAEVEATEHPVEKDAEAAILYKKERVYFDYNPETGWSQMREAHYRIKIYKKEGLERGTFQVPLYVSGTDGERISGVKGYTFNLANGSVEKVKLKKDGVFQEEVNKYRNKVSITMPEVKEGSVLDIVFDIRSTLYWHMDDFQFQYGVPVNEVDVTIEIPQNFIFKRYGRGFYPIDIAQSRKNRKIAVLYRQSSDPGRLVQSSGARTQSGELDFYENVYKVKSTAIPSLKEVDYTDNIDNYRSSVKFELASTQFPNRPYKNYSLSWEDVAESIYKYDSFGGELAKVNYFKGDLDPLLAEASDDMQKVALVYGYVQNKMTWNNFNSIGSNGLKKAYKEGVGNVADINLMLTAMLRHAGLKADPVLVSTKSHGIPLFPTQDGFNYVITAVQTDKGMILCDATEKKAIPGVLAPRVMNWNGRLVRKDGSSTSIKLTPNGNSKLISFAQVKIGEEGQIEGKLRNQFPYQRAFQFRKGFDENKEDDYIEQLENRYGEMEILDFELKNLKQMGKPVSEIYSFEKENQTEIIGNKIYFRPMLFMAMDENPFKLDSRDYPVDFSYPKTGKVTINFEIPEGYQVETMPETVSFALPEGLGAFKYNLKAMGNKLQFSCSTEINTSIVPPNYYQALKEFYSRIIKKEAEKVVLTRI